MCGNKVEGTNTSNGTCRLGAGPLVFCSTSHLFPAGCPTPGSVSLWGPQRQNGFLPHTKAVPTLLASVLLQSVIKSPCLLKSLSIFVGFLFLSFHFHNFRRPLWFSEYGPWIDGINIAIRNEKFRPHPQDYRRANGQSQTSQQSSSQDYFLCIVQCSVSGVTHVFKPY